MQATFWAYSQTGALGSMFFRKYTIINKSDRNFENMYVSMWSDVDLGNSNDDMAGCDSLLSLGYCYNANAVDATYTPLPPPAVGFDFFQGPMVDGEPLPMTAFYYFVRGDPNFTDPTQGDPQGSTQFYNFFQGLVGLTGEPFLDPDGNATKFVLPGDPQAGTGWLDGQILPTGDRRIGSASGPFTMEPGDTQDVVVAEIVAGALPGVDRISAIGLLKFYDAFAQVAYDNNFDLPAPPPPPTVVVTELDREIVLDWSADFTATESFDEKEYQFQGYNVYQLPSAGAQVSEGIRIATFDVRDGVGKIEDFLFDPSIGSVIKIPVQFGNDTGIKRFISITEDAIKQLPLINGIKYYFAVTAYTYNFDLTAIPTNIENPISTITVVPHTNDPGVTYGDGTGSGVDITHEGTADGGPIVTIVDPAKTTGDTYEVYFNDRSEIRNANGDWIAASTVMRKFNPDDPDTLTGTTIDIAAVYGPNSTSIDLLFHLDLVHHYYGWADGVTLTFPVGTSIIEVPPFEVGGSDGSEPVEIIGNVVKLGITDNSQTQGGHYHEGGEDWVVRVDPTTYTMPLSVDWEVHDDGYAGGQNELGTTVVDSIGFAARVAQYWNLGVVNGSPLLERQGNINGTDIWPPRTDSPTNLGLDAAPVVDGFQINVAVGYEAPLTQSANNPPTVNGVELTWNGDNWSDGENWDLIDFTYFGFPDGTANESITSYGGVGGTTSVDLLQQDYELRWTGVLADTVINGDTIAITQSGGSIATLFGASLYDLVDHPLNPTGLEEAFTVRIPFEVWNLDNEEQVNLLMWDRHGEVALPDFQVWNTLSRVYTWVVNTPYATDLIDETSQVVLDNATWNWVWLTSTWTTGDIMQINYDNPIQLGIDRYTFSTTAAGMSSELAKSQVSEINVFPNPYYGVNSEEINKYNRFVTFSHLPDNATIRIFNLAGVLVKTITKEDPGQFQRWDLANESGLPVASGLYIAYIELPDLGETKILKVAIIQEQQILDRF